jgi:FkbM family methyltransferase
MSEKPTRPLPLPVMAALKRLLPRRIYDRYVGRHEHGSMRLWRHIVSQLPANACVLDVGAYKGEYALATHALRADLRIHAFEPNPAQLEELTSSCAPLGIEVEGIALAETSGEVTFTVNGAESGIREATDQSAITVAAQSLDDWGRAHAQLPSLMKIDVEGGEAAILRGGRRLLAEARPIILCEVLTDGAGRSVGEATPADYLFFEIDEDRGLQLQERPTRRVWRYYNWLLVPAERRGEIEGGS